MSSSSVFLRCKKKPLKLLTGLVVVTISMSYSNTSLKVLTGANFTATKIDSPKTTDPPAVAAGTMIHGLITPTTPQPGHPAAVASPALNDSSNKFPADFYFVGDSLLRYTAFEVVSVLQGRHETHQVFHRDAILRATAPAVHFFWAPTLANLTDKIQQICSRKSSRKGVSDRPVVFVWDNTYHELRATGSKSFSNRTELVASLGDTIKTKCAHMLHSIWYYEAHSVDKKFASETHTNLSMAGAVRLQNIERHPTEVNSSFHIANCVGVVHTTESTKEYLDGGGQTVDGRHYPLQFVHDLSQDFLRFLQFSKPCS